METNQGAQQFPKNFKRMGLTWNIEIEEENSDNKSGPCRQELQPDRSITI